MTLAERMKTYEKPFSPILVRRMPMVVRVDGRHFHSLLRGAEKPFDECLRRAMVQTAIALCREIQGSLLAYVQSDEISVLAIDYRKLDSQPWFGGEVIKICSVAASIATVAFNAHSPYTPGMFDARVFNVPREDVNNYFVWRQRDWERNSIQMYARTFFSHEQLLGLSIPELHEQLHGVGKNWALLEPHWKNGSTVIETYGGFSEITTPTFYGGSLIENLLRPDQE